jgi:hypothetical protein
VTHLFELSCVRTTRYEEEEIFLGEIRKLIEMNFLWASKMVGPMMSSPHFKNMARVE